jgi:hypothetical protein
MDYQQRAAGERPEEQATSRERTDFWIDQCYININKVRVANGDAPYVPKRWRNK